MIYPSMMEDKYIYTCPLLEIECDALPVGPVFTIETEQDLVLVLTPHIALFVAGELLVPLVDFRFGLAGGQMLLDGLEVARIFIIKLNQLLILCLVPLHWRPVLNHFLLSS